MGTKIYNSDATRALIANAGIMGADPVPQELAEKALPVIDMTPDFHRITKELASVDKTTTGTGNVYVSSSTKRTFITAIGHSLTADATADNTSSVVSGTSAGDGTGKDFLRISKQTTTAVNDLNRFITFNPPLELSRGTTITHGSTFTVGASTYSTQVFGFEVNLAIN